MTQMESSTDIGGFSTFPNKRNEMGTKKSGNELQVELQAWFQDFLKLPFVSRMFSVKTFFTHGELPEDVGIGREIDSASMYSRQPSVMNSGLLNSVQGTDSYRADGSLFNYRDQLGDVF